MYKLDDKVVYPGHGVAVIEEIVEQAVGNKVISFFKLKFLYKDMTILVPTATTTIAGIRSLSNKIDVDFALSELTKVPKKLDHLDFTPSSWNKRNKGYQLKIQGGNLLDIATIYRDLMYTSKYKELSFGEKNLLQFAEELLLQEIQEIKSIDRENAMNQLRSHFKQFNSDHTMHSSKQGRTVQII